ncbi:hypothetical protein F8M41_023969 [Gigaspora margarita]|uniref:Yeast cell wall synthesis Kre9/Knh1-like N-terminal domain-containing protein n=1 Tax=Gigaspora margarita TaxID=4874 RepID=A0A8H4ACI1_GIGMA|nr:hypothetical protein F8M41_023969 [Gigaspora margarita]
MKFLKVLFLITALLSTYVFAALPNPGSLLIAPIAGSQHVSGRNITLTFIPGADLPPSFDVIRIGRAYVNDFHVLDTNIQLPPGQNQYTFSYTIPAGLPSDPRFVIGGGTTWNVQSATFAVNKPNFGVVINRPSTRQSYRVGQRVNIAWRPSSRTLYKSSNITQFLIFDNVKNTWTPILDNSVPVNSGRYRLTLPNSLAKQNGYQFGILVERNGNQEAYYSNPFRVV